MKLYLIAGEASGDLHGSNLIRSLRRQQPDCEVRCWGGDMMQAAGGQVVKHYRDLAFMGFIEVIMNLRTILRNLEFCKEDIAAWKPDALVLIDYPGFNLRIAKWAHENGIRVVYYISPQIWAWKESRVHQIIRDVQTMCVVLPFEKEFYAKYNYPVEFVGHPLLDAIESARLSPEQIRQELGLDQRPVIALLPGSRKQEISTILPLMCEATTYFPDYQFVIAGAPSQPSSFYQHILKSNEKQVRVITGKTYELLSIASAGLVTSGTATLEAGLFGMPQVVCYKGSAISYRIAKKLIKVNYISLVNLILDRPAVTELIQQDLNPVRIREELSKLLENKQAIAQLKNDYEILRRQLGGPGASDRTASVLLKSLKG